MATRTHVLIAVRGGRTAKSRCSELLGCDGREDLTELMLFDMLAAISSARLVTKVWIVSPTFELREIGKAMGCLTIAQTGSGLNPAFAAGMRAIGSVPRLLLPGDLPWLRGEEIDAAIRQLDYHQVVVAPSRGGGTGGLLLGAEVALAPRYGPDSCARHIFSAARAAGYSTSTFVSDGFTRDIDDADDIRELASSDSSTLSGAFLREMIFEPA